MSPAFSSPKQAGAFALLLLTILLLPALVGKSCLPRREQVYATQGLAWGPYPWDRQQIFEEQGDIDIAFIGSSSMWYAIDTPHVQEELSKKLGRQAVVRSICWGGPGFDALYFMAKDLLEQRKVRLLVFYDESNVKNRNRQISTWFRFGDDAGALAGLPLEQKEIFYFASILGMPRNLLGLARRNIPLEAYTPESKIYEVMNHTPDPATRLGSMSNRLAFGSTPPNYIPYTPYKPFVTPTRSDVCIYQDTTETKFEFTNEMTFPWQMHFARKFAAMATGHGTRLALLHIPSLDEPRRPVIRERQNWSSALQAEVAMIGIPPSSLFAGLNEEDIHKLYFNPTHMNKNGQEYFTPLITPALFQLYEFKANH